MSYCPRCVQPVPPEATQCPSCRFDIPAAARPGPPAAPDHVAEMKPEAPPARSGVVTAATPSDPTELIAPVADEDHGLIPGFTEGPSHSSSPAEDQPHYRWGVGGVVVVCLAVLAVIGVLVGSRIAHHGTVSASPAATPSGARSSSGSGPGSSRAANPQNGRAQASVIDAYLTRSGRARARIGAAISAISGCTNIESAVTTLHNAATIRSRIATSLASTDVSALPHGAAAVADLGRAMRTSASADRHYAVWGQAVTGCHGHAPHNAQYAAAQRNDFAATVAKQRFVDEWNPIAAMYGLAKQNANTI